MAALKDATVGGAGPKVYAIGVSMTKFCRPGTPNSGYVQTGTEATIQALADAGLDYSQLKGAVVSYCYGAPTCGQRVLHEVVKTLSRTTPGGPTTGPTGIPIFNTNNNCSSASAALYLARTLVKGAGTSNEFGAVLALGFEEMERGLSEPFPDKESPIALQIQRLFDLGAKEGKINPQMKNFTSDIIKVFSHAALEYEQKISKIPPSGRGGESFKKDWALVANKNHRHGASNPRTMISGRKVPSLEKVAGEKGTLVHPITSGMSAPTANGAAACVLVSEAFLATLPAEVQHRAVEIAGQSMCSDLPSSFQDVALVNQPANVDGEGTGDGTDSNPTPPASVPPFWALAGGHMARTAGARALREANTCIENVGVLEVHDCFSPNEVFMYEALGMCPSGTGLEFFKKQGRWTLTSGGVEQHKLQAPSDGGGDGQSAGPQWVVNPSGGLESKGHPIGATGLAQCFELVSHLRGEAGARQVEPRPVFGLQHNFGFNGGVVVTVYKRTARGALGLFVQAPVPRPLSATQLHQLAPLRSGWSNFQERDIGLVFRAENGNLTGTLPAELRGTFFRNGPGLSSVYGTPLAHPIDGDGLVARLAFTGDGSAYLNTAFVQTFSHKEEQNAKKLLYPGQMGTRVPEDQQELLPPVTPTTGKMLGVGKLKIDPLEKKKKNNKFKFRDQSHTNTYVWGGKLLACHEYVLPHVLNPQTLETIGPSNLGEVLGESGPFAAHFRVDHHAQRLVTFGFRPANPLVGDPPVLQITEVDKEWKAFRKYELHIEGLNYSHDLAVTAGYYVFQMTPFVKVNEEAIMKIVKGKELPGEQMRLNPDLPCRLVIISRQTGEVVAQRDMAEKCHVYHFGNSWEEQQPADGGSETPTSTLLPILHLQATCLPASFNMQFEGGLWLSNTNSAPGQLMNLTIDLARDKKAVMTRVAEAASNEFPILHPDLHCGPPKPISLSKSADQVPRFSWLMANGTGDTLPFNAVIKYDALDPVKGRQVYMVPGCVLGEPTFAPRRSSRHSSSILQSTLDQDDGWIIVQVYRPSSASNSSSGTTTGSSLSTAVADVGLGKTRGGVTEFHVLKGKHIDQGPIAVLSLGCTLPYGFHGTWCDDIYAPLVDKDFKSKL